MAGGPLLGLFVMGMFMPCINTKVLYNLTLGSFLDVNINI